MNPSPSESVLTQTSIECPRPQPQIPGEWPEDFVCICNSKTTPDDIPGVDFDEVRVRRDFLPTVTQSGWNSTLSVMMSDQFRVLRSLNDRDNCQTTWFDTATQTHRTIYLKRFQGTESHTGWKEALQILAAKRVGVPTVEVLACGRALNGQGTCTSSFLMTAAVVSLEPDASQNGAVWRESVSLFARFEEQNRSGVRTEVVIPERMRFLQQFSRTVRQLHRSNMTHGDLYLQHAFPSTTSTFRNEMVLIDFQLARQDHGLMGWYCWIKDLWQVRFSMIRLDFDSHLVRHWYQCYFSEDNQLQPLSWKQTLITWIVRISSPRRQLKYFINRLTTRKARVPSTPMMPIPNDRTSS